MDIIEMIRVTGSLPRVAEMENGTKLELFVRRRDKGKGFIATLWVMVDGLQEHIFSYGTGETADEAKEDLKNKILNP